MVANSKGIRICENQTEIISRKINNNWDASFQRVFAERLWPLFIYQVCMQRKLVNLLPQHHLYFKWLLLQQSYDQILAFMFLGVVPVFLSVLVVGTNYYQWNWAYNLARGISSIARNSLKSFMVTKITFEPFKNLCFIFAVHPSEVQYLFKYYENFLELLTLKTERDGFVNCK